MPNPKDIAGAAKPPLGLIPPVAEVLESLVLAHGAAKYGPFNWRGEQITILRYIDAMKRHLAAFVDGQDLDPESMLPHLAHVRATAGIVLDAMSLKRVIDDRPLEGEGSEFLKMRIRDVDKKPDQTAKR